MDGCCSFNYGSLWGQWFYKFFCLYYTDAHSTCCCLLWNCTLWSTSFLELTYSVTSYTAKRDTEIFSDRIKSLTTPLYWSETQNTSLTVTQPPHTVTIGSRDSIFFSTTVSFLSQQKSDLIYAGKIIFRMKYIWQINLTNPTVERAVRAADLTNAGLLGLIAVFSRETCNDWQVSAWRAIFSWLPQGFRLALWLFLPMGYLNENALPVPLGTKVFFSWHSWHSHNATMQHFYSSKSTQLFSDKVNIWATGCSMPSYH